MINESQIFWCKFFMMKSLEDKFEIKFKRVNCSRLESTRCWTWHAPKKDILSSWWNYHTSRKYDKYSCEMWILPSKFMKCLHNIKHLRTFKELSKLAPVVFDQLTWIRAYIPTAVPVILVSLRIVCKYIDTFIGI